MYVCMYVSFISGSAAYMTDEQTYKQDGILTKMRTLANHGVKYSNRFCYRNLN